MTDKPQISRVRLVRGGVLERSVDGGETWAREPGPVMPPIATEYATRVPGKWLLAEVDASVMHGSSPEHLAQQIRQVPGVVDVFLDGFRVGESSHGPEVEAPQLPTPGRDLEPAEAHLAIAASLNGHTLRRDSNGCLRLSAHVTPDDAVPYDVLRPDSPDELRKAVERIAAPALKAWGACLGVHRRGGQSDADYRDRLIEAMEERVEMTGAAQPLHAQPRHAKALDEIAALPGAQLDLCLGAPAGWGSLDLDQIDRVAGYVKRIDYSVAADGKVYGFVIGEPGSTPLRALFEVELVHSEQTLGSWTEALVVIQRVAGGVGRWKVLYRARQSE